MIKRIIICCNAYPPNFIGGAELIAHHQAKKLQKLGHEVIIFTGDTQPFGQRHSIRKEVFDGLTVYRIFLTHEDYEKVYINFSHKKVEEHFKRIITEFSPEIAHFHNIIGLSVGLIRIAKQRGIKTILTLHDHWGFCIKNTIIKRDNEICKDYTHCPECLQNIPDGMNRNIPIRMRQDFIAFQFDCIDAFISPSQYLADAYIRAIIPPDKMHVIWNGIQVDQFANLGRKINFDRIRFTFIGYFGMHKGIHILLEAVEYLAGKYDFEINLIGDGDLFTTYRKMADEKKISSLVRFWGKIDNIKDAYLSTDVLILPSVWPENQPVTITEAMASKIPVIASDIGGIPELIEDGVSGYLFEPGNSYDLAEKMTRYIENPLKIQEMGERAYGKIKNYTLANQVLKIIEIYNKDMMPDSNLDHGKEVVIICYGIHVDSACFNVITDFPSYVGNTRCRFISYEWLWVDQMTPGDIFWIIDMSTGLQGLSVGLLHQLPLVVPEKNILLRELCKTGNYGLFYGTASEAYECILYLVKREKARKFLAENGEKFINSLMEVI